MIDFDEKEDPELERLARGLGAAAAERLDLDRTVQGVLGRLKSARVEERPLWAQPRVLRIAAAVIVLIGGGFAARALLQPSPAPVAAARGGSEVDDLSADQLSQLLPALDSAGDAADAPDEGGIEGLSATELRRLLAAMRGEG